MNLDEIEEDTGNVLNSNCRWISWELCGLNIKLIIWLYDVENGMHHNLLQAELLVKLDAAHEKDKLPSRKRVRNQRKEATWEIPVVRHFTILSSVIILPVQSNWRRCPFKPPLNTCRHSRRKERGRKHLIEYVILWWSSLSTGASVLNATTKHVWINFTSYKKGVTRIGVKECYLGCLPSLHGYKNWRRLWQYGQTILPSRSIKIEWDNCRGIWFTIRCKERGYWRAIKIARGRNVEVCEIL